MANAVFNSLESYFSGKKLKPNLEWAKFDLSNIKSMDMDMGILYPHYIEEVMPGDKFKIKNIIKAQALPLTNPVFNNMKIYTYYYFVPYYLLWHKWDRWIEGGRDGTYTCELPVIETTDYGDNQNGQPEEETIHAEGIFGSNTLWDYMEMPLCKKDYTEKLKIKVPAFKFAAYQRIYRDYFMNQDVQTETNVNEWFPEDDFDFQLHDGINCMMGEGETPETIKYAENKLSDYQAWAYKPNLLYLRTRNWNKDYFTSMWFSPQRGPTQSVPIGASIDFSEVIAKDETQIGSTYGTMVILGQGNPEENKIGAVAQGSTQTGWEYGLREIGNKARIQGGFTLSDLHTAQQIEIWMERNMSVKAHYNEFLRIHFDDAPLDERLTKPDYIGGTVQDIQISEVMQTSQTTDTSAQGTMTGSAHSFDNQDVGKYNVHEFGVIIGLCCIMPETYYKGGLNKHDIKETRYDYPFPEFANLEPQAVIRAEIEENIPEKNQSPMAIYKLPVGYVGRYDEYRFHKSMAVGAFRNPDAQDWKAWIMTREYDLPVLSNQLINTHQYLGQTTSPGYVIGEEGKEYTSMITHNAWLSGKTVNPFIVQIGMSVEAVRPLPYISDPTKANER